MNLQETFNYVAASLLKQGCKSVNSEGDCKYRGIDGTKCAAGFLITDEEYRPKMEGKRIDSIYNDIRYSISNLNEENIELVKLLQTCHDGYDPSLWPDRLKQIAKEFKLEYNLPNS